jgi:divalent metal cation (Fe/Co/Zn/Cd) transporter
MDRTPSEAVLMQIRGAVLDLPEVEAIETLKVRRVGLGIFVNIHVEADPNLSLREAHILSGKVKAAIRTRVPEVQGIIAHMEPHEVGSTPSSGHGSVQS